MIWERIEPRNQQLGFGDSSTRPGKIWGHTCNAIKGGKFLYVFGGKDARLSNQVHVFDVERQIWTQPVIKGVPPSPRDSHSCTTVGTKLFVFGGTDGTKHFNDLHILDTSSHTWKCPPVRGQDPEAREAHTATLIGKRIYIFGGCAKSSDSDDEVFYNNLYILNTENFVWRRPVTTGKPPSARGGHTCSAWKNKIIVVGGQDKDDYYYSDVHILNTDTCEWSELKTSGQILTPRTGHVTVALEGDILVVFGGYTDSQYVYGDLYILHLETAVWFTVSSIGQGPCGRFSAAAVCLRPYKPDLLFLLGGCDQNLEPLDDIYYLHTEAAYKSRRLSLRTVKDKARTLAVSSIERSFQARIVENTSVGYTIEAMIDGRPCRGVIVPRSSVSMQKLVTRKRLSMWDDTDHYRRAKMPKVLIIDSDGRVHQDVCSDANDGTHKKVANTVLMIENGSAVETVTSDVKEQINKVTVKKKTYDKFDHRTKSETVLIIDSEGRIHQAVCSDANGKVGDSNDMDIAMIKNGDVDLKMVETEEVETADVNSDVNDEDPRRR